MSRRPVFTRAQTPLCRRWVQEGVRSLLLLALASTAACAPGGQPGVQRQAIIGGALAPGEGSVVQLVSYPPAQDTLFLCTATVVHPRQLITAAHCVDGVNHPDHTFGVFLGADATNLDLTSLLSVKQLDYPFEYRQSDSYADVALVTLDAELSGLPAHPLIIAPPAPSLVGSAARLVGYGRSSYDVVDSAGPRRAVDTTVAAIEDQFLVIGDVDRHACIGDSGGPAFAIGPGSTSPPGLLGVNSNGPFGCTGASSFTRLDRHADWLAAHLLVEPTPDLAPPPDLTPPTVEAPDLGGSTDLDSKEDSPGPGGRDAGGCQAASSAVPGGFAPLLALLLAAAWRRRRAPLP